MKEANTSLFLWNNPPRCDWTAADKSTGGEVANALVCKTSIHGFNSHPVLHKINNLHGQYSCTQ
jgi:hypothetical protein